MINVCEDEGEQRVYCRSRRKMVYAQRIVMHYAYRRPSCKHKRCLARVKALRKRYNSIANYFVER